MLFTSLHWIVFLLVVFVVFHAAPGRWRRWLMLGASIYFYASWSAPYLLLIFGQLLVDWTCGHLLGRTEDPRRRKRLLLTSIVVNLSALCVFKYYGFFARSLSALGLHLPVVELALPLGISFYTFESMSYTIDVYGRRIEPVRSPLQLALFITWFPHLIAGPIIRPAQLLPQLDEISAVTRTRFFGGLSLMAIGYAKKLLGADWLAQVADPIFAAPGNFTALELLVGVYAYAFQLYFDFSAYTDIARGASRWFGIELPENFNNPFLSTSVTDYWRRWHMTLSHWLRDYLYFSISYASLGGTRLARWRPAYNVIVTMTLAGLWHGASWTCVLFGAMHGVYLAVEQTVGVRAEYDGGWRGRIPRQILTFHLVCAAFVMFRSQTLGQALQVYRGIATPRFYISQAMLLYCLGALVIIGGYWSIAGLRERVLAFDPGPSLWRQGAYAVALGSFVTLLMALGASTNVFIYFQF
jgi:D-alanyl-lipoteichoic acid acyltransferase DltB (MBOAT superfamily)